MVLRSLRLVLAVAVAISFATGLAGQRAPITVDDIYSYEGWRRLNGSATATMSWAPAADPWISDTHYLWPAPSDEGSPADSDVSWSRVEAASGRSEPLFRHAQVERALNDIGVSSADARAALRTRPTIFDRQRRQFLLTIGDDLFLYNIATTRAVRATSSRGSKIQATFSPDGQRVAFVKDNNLFVASLDRGVEASLTTDGAPRILNGILDWVYSEEIYGRGSHRGYWWSPDSSHIAFLRLDESPVPDYTLVDDLSYRPRVERWPYPKAGDPNPIVRLGIAAITGGPTRWVDTSRYEDFLIVNVGWSPDSRDVMYQVQDRRQTWLDLNRADSATGASSNILREQGKPWVERWQDSSVDPVWLKDGSFLWLSERGGWRHIYRYDTGSGRAREVTTGPWEVRKTHGIDEAGAWVYFSATREGPLGLDLYRVRPDGGPIERLSATAGTHQIFLSPARTWYLDSWSDINTPPQVRLHRTNAREAVRTVDANPVPALGEYGLPKPEFMQVRTRDGFVMEAQIIKPPSFDPSRRYPVYQFIYGAPHIQSVLNKWSSSVHLYHQMLAQRGIIVWMCDPRTASGKGMQSAWPAYGKLGEVELRDVEDGVAWLKQQQYVDPSRIGMAGVSYGGYLTLYALTHSRSFTMGIAEGAISDWRNYDTVYTERYLGLPDENPDAYRNSSPRFDAAHLRGQLLLIHGALDDNVHAQNTSQMAYALQQAGLPFRLMIYPKSAHGLQNTRLLQHLRQTMLDFTTQNLLR